MRRKISLDRLVHKLDEIGLSDAEIEKQRKSYGANYINESGKSSTYQLLRDTIADPMIWFLFFASSLFFFIGQVQEGVILVIAMLPLLGMDAFLHWRTSNATKSLRSHLSGSIQVNRNNRKEKIATSSLVPGDVVYLDANDYIPADGIFIRSNNIQMDESPLTGESLPIKKTALTELPQNDNTDIDESCWAYAGTKLLSGSGTIKIAYTGIETAYGEIVDSVTNITQEKTPLQLEIAKITKYLLYAAALFCLILASARLIQGYGIIDAILGAATLAVAAIPEEFPVVFTFFLGVGVYRMARRKALVRRAVSVENIGRVTCICSDKTGTITEGKLKLAHTFASGSYTKDELLLAAAYASRKDSHDPLDEAILAALPEVDTKLEVIALFPFTEASRRETSVISIAGSFQAYSKGSPEVILRMCNLAASEIEQQEKNIALLAKEGHKIIACAGKSIVTKEWKGEEPVSNFNFLGVLAFEDPVRSEVPAAILACRNADIHVLMITGDHPETARTIAKEIGMGVDHDIRVLNAEKVDIEALPGEHFLKIDVVARALPSQKLKVVTRLKASGEIVAVTGDGINDVPALKAADIGMAMGLRGTKPAREVSSIVLLDDNFATIVAGIAEGRQLLINLRSSFQYLVAVHIPLVLTSALIPMFGFPLLYLPIHIVWLELIIHPTALFAFQNEASKDLISEKKYKFKTVFSQTDWIYAVVIGFSVTVAVSVAYIIGDPGTIQARTLALGTLIGANILTTLLFSAFRNWPSKLIGGIVLISTGVIFFTTQSTKILHLAPLNSSIDWIYIFGLSTLSTLLPYVLLRFFSRERMDFMIKKLF